MLWDGSLFQLGLDRIEFIIAILMLMVLCGVSILQQKRSVREYIAGKNIFLRWGIWYALLFVVILWGYYGPGYSVSEFIYQGF